MTTRRIRAYDPNDDWVVVWNDDPIFGDGMEAYSSYPTREEADDAVKGFEHKLEVIHRSRYVAKKETVH